MNTYTRRRGTQEVAGSKSGGGGQSERSVERPAGTEWRDGENALLVRCFTPWYRVSRWLGCALRILIAHACRTRASMEPLEIGAIEYSALFLEIIVTARCEKLSATLRRKSSRGLLSKLQAPVI